MAEYKKKKAYEDLEKDEIGSAYDQRYFNDAEKQHTADIVNAARRGETDWSDAHNYVESTRKKYGYTGGADGSQFNPTGGFHFENAPEYVSQRQQQIDAALAALKNRPEFAYDPAKDPKYGIIADKYDRAGKAAMQNTVGEVAARTGGLASSYATAAGQQAYNGYMEDMNANILPKLEEIAYQRYKDQEIRDRQNLDLMMQQEAQDYGRFMDERNQFNADRGFLYGQNRDQIADDRYNTEWKHGLDREALEDQRYDQEWQHGLDREAIEDQRYNAEFAYRKQKDAQARADRLAAERKREAERYKKDAKEWKEKYGDDGGIDTTSVLNLGYGPISGEYLADLEASGEIESYEENGKIKFRKRKPKSDPVDDRINSVIGRFPNPRNPSKIWRG